MKMLQNKTFTHSFRRFLLHSTALVSLGMLSAGATMAAEDDDCLEALVPQPQDCARANADVVVRMPVGKNDELIRTRPGDNFETSGFSISIDNEMIAGAPLRRDPRRDADIAASGRNVDVRYDGLDLRPVLNVSTPDLRATYRAGEQVQFRASSNYPAYITRAEIRILDLSRRGVPVVAALPVAPNGSVAWTMPDGPQDGFAYVLRVYDAAGRYDETRQRTLTRTEQAFAPHETVGGPVVAAGEGEDNTRRRSIPIAGGRVTVAGTQIAADGRVTVMGEKVPVDASGKFVVSRILPVGDQIVTVEVVENGQTRTIVRDVPIPKKDVFYVAIADLTFGKRLQDDAASADPDYKETYSDGRLAYYVKSKTARGYTITSSLDSGEGPLDEVFSRLDDKDPRRVLQRLDPEDMYPTYGDDSAAFDDTPTAGRFYLRVEKDASSFVWGDFKANVTGSTLLSNTRALYGAQLEYNTQTVTEAGDPVASVVLYAAQPDTLPQRDVLRGTGGSVYFLKRQDINGGSEVLRVETVDPVTGRVVSQETLSEGVDYEIDYIQGVVILTRPLNSSAGSGALVSSSAGGQYDVNLVAQYEYTPTTGDLSGASVGGRVAVQATPKLRVGVTAMRETTDTADQDMAGVDVRYQLGTLSYLQLEAAETRGPGFGRSVSSDGGLTLASSGGGVLGTGRAYSFDSHFDLQDLGLGRTGFVDLYYDRKETGFSSLSQDITQNQRLFGMRAEIELSERLTFGMDAEDFEKADGTSRATGELRLSYDINAQWRVSGGLAVTDKTTLGDPAETGRRTDFGLRIAYEPSDDLLLFAFGQATVDRSGGLSKNDRLGVGFEAQVTEKVAVSGEVSDGTTGLGGQVRVSYAPTADNEAYLGYTLDPTRTGAGYSLVGEDRGTLVFGGRYRQSARLSTFTENTVDLFGERRAVTRAYGVTYTPDARWTLSGAIELGEVRDATNGNFDRDAFSFGVAHVDEAGTKARGRLEYRTEDGAGTAQDRDTWAFSGGYEYRADDNWRFLANIDALYSDAVDGSFRDGEYLEASLGYAYRPVDNDRLNMLLRYTYLHDLPGEDQVTASGSVDGPLQKSHVISVDANYDLSPKLTVGGKYGYRKSQVAARGTDTFTDSTAHLGILRLDWHVVQKWDVMAETRILFTEQSDVSETGSLIGIYRHFSNNAKLGLGYEWGKVSDDMTDLDYVSRGVFLNVIAKF